MEKGVLDFIKEQLGNRDVPKYRKRQLAAIEKYLSGESTSTIAKELQITPRSVQRYIHNYHENGLSSILDPSKPGNKNKLSEEQEEKIKQNLQNEPIEYGYLFPKWTARILTQHIMRAYGVSLSEESCRKIIDSYATEKENQSISKRRNQFIEQLDTYQSDPDTEIWFLSDIYLGIRERRKNKEGKLPYYPNDLLKDPLSIPKVDLTRKAKEEWILCLKAMKSGAFFYRHHTDHHEEFPRYREVIKKLYSKTNHSKIVLIMANKAIHRRNLLRLNVGQSKKTIIVRYFPPNTQDLNPLNQFKENLINDFHLKKKGTHERKILSEPKTKQILKYLDQISQS